MFLGSHLNQSLASWNVSSVAEVSRRMCETSATIDAIQEANDCFIGAGIETMMDILQ
jgi:hypothetical protein